MRSPAAYLSAFLALRQAGFREGQSVLAPGVGGSVGNATLKVARALGASQLVSTAGSAAKKAAAAADGGLGQVGIVNLQRESLAARPAAVRRVIRTRPAHLAQTMARINSPKKTVTPVMGQRRSCQRSASSATLSVRRTLSRSSCTALAARRSASSAARAAS
jgi:D-arabinose 1-dehydrogenase-like Zn-dependent alcohol dehydrogenase